jgi:type II secretory ATPase GspE/PulE/Tfp pilus assembly ATPase PilB-like protein
MDAMKEALHGGTEVLLLGRIPDAETAMAAVEAARDHLVLAAIEADSAAAGLFRLIEFGVSRDALADRVVAALGQRLPRKLCEECREAYRPSVDALRRANLHRLGVETLNRARQRSLPHCDRCQGIGYCGCAAIYEILPMTQRLRQLLRTSATEREIGLEARKEGMDSLSEAGLKLVVQGTTSAEELRRVLLSPARERAEAC